VVVVVVVVGGGVGGGGAFAWSRLWTSLVPTSRRAKCMSVFDFRHSALMTISSPPPPRQHGRRRTD